MINNGRTGTPKTCRLLVASGFHTTSTALAHLIYISESVIEAIYAGYRAAIGE
jgi:hypothetical protein